MPFFLCVFFLLPSSPRVSYRNWSTESRLRKDCRCRVFSVLGADPADVRWFGTNTCEMRLSGFVDEPSAYLSGHRNLFWEEISVYSMTFWMLFVFIFCWSFGKVLLIRRERVTCWWQVSKSQRFLILYSSFFKLCCVSHDSILSLIVSKVRCLRCYL